MEPMQSMSVNPYAFMTLVGGSFTAMAGLAIWFVKWSAKRTAEITDKHIGYLTVQAEVTKSVHERHSQSLSEMAMSVSEMAKAMTLTNDTLRPVVEFLT